MLVSFLLLLTACDGNDTSGNATITTGSSASESPPAEDSTSSVGTDEGSAGVTLTPSGVAGADPYQIPEPFNLLLVQTGGTYTDKDGYSAEERVFVNTPVIAHESDMDALAAICPDSDFANIVEQAGLTLEGGLVQTFDVVYDPASDKFPFPLQQYLSQQESSGLGAGMPGLFFTGSDPSSRPQVVCASSESDSAAEYVGFATLLPLAEATPNNPDRKLPTCDPGLALYDPLYSANTSDLGTNWAARPSTEYGPDDIGLSFGWTFDVDPSVVRGRCLDS